MIYLDNAATSYRKPAAVSSAIYRHTLKSSMNAGHGGHMLSIRGVEILEEVKALAASLFHLPSAENIAFIPNATYGLNCAIFGLLQKGGHAIITSMEHNSVLRPIHKCGNYTVCYADEFGYVDETDIENAIREDTRLIVCTHVSNVTGSIEPVARIGRIAHLYNIPFLVDGSQAAGCIDVDIPKIGADIYVCSGHKGLMGPLGTGICYVNPAIALEPYIVGGTGNMSKQLTHPKTMPEIIHAGTLNTPAIAALGESIRFILKRGVSVIHKHESFLASECIRKLSRISNVKTYGSRIYNRTGVVAFNIDGMDSSETADILSSKYNIYVRGGFHCSPLAHKTIGTYDTGAVRASFGFFSKASENDALVNAVREIAENI